MAGGGSSELRAVLDEVRALNARLTACEKDLVRLSRLVANAGGGPPVVLDAASSDVVLRQAKAASELGAVRGREMGAAAVASAAREGERVAKTSAERLGKMRKAGRV